MASLQSIRQAITADMRADGHGIPYVLAYKDTFEQSIHVIDYQARLLSKKERTNIVTRLPIHNF